MTSRRPVRSSAGVKGFRFRGDIINEIHHYLDVVMLLQHIGAAPSPT